MRPLSEVGRTSDVVDAMNAVIAQRGLTAPSQRVLAAEIRLSPGTLNYEYGGRAEMMRRACVQAGRDHAREWAGRWSWLPGDAPAPSCLLPSDPRNLAHERQWAAWRELGRGDPAFEPGLGVGIEGERRAVESLRTRRDEPVDDVVDVAHALLTGLVTVMLDPHDPWSLERAAEVLRAAWP